MITKNFRLNALANQYSAALYDHVTVTSGGDYFMIDAGGEPVRAEIIGRVKGIRDLIDSYALEALRGHYPAAHWESIGIELLSRCVDAGGLTDYGRSIWQCMVSDMGLSVARGGQNNA